MNLMPPAKMEERERFLAAMRNVAASVTVVTTNGEAGRHGATVSSFCSVSADPATLLVCLERGGNTHAAIPINAIFCVNVLSVDDQALATAFAGAALNSSDGACDPFERVKLVEKTHVPVFEGRTAFECKVADTICAPTHDIFLGEVTTIHQGNSAPLIYLDRTFSKVAKL